MIRPLPPRVGLRRLRWPLAASATNRCRPSCARSRAPAPILQVERVGQEFRGHPRRQRCDLHVQRPTLHALIGPNGAGKTTAFNVSPACFRRRRRSRLDGHPIGGLSPETITGAGIGRSFQITNLFPALSVEENIRLAVQARPPPRFNGWASARAIAEIERETAGIMNYLGVAGIEQAEAGALSYGGQRLLDMGLALATKPKLLLLDEPLAGLAAAERERIGNLVKKLSADLPVLLVEHDIDRVFKLADHVTVMNDGKVLVDGTVEAARSSKEVQEVYIGSGAAHVAAKPRDTAASTKTLRRSPRSTPSTARATSFTTSASTCTRTKSWRCSAATAPASRPCSNR